MERTPIDMMSSGLPIDDDWTDEEAAALAAAATDEEVAEVHAARQLRRAG